MIELDTLLFDVDENLIKSSIIIDTDRIVGVLDNETNYIDGVDMCSLYLDNGACVDVCIKRSKILKKLKDREFIGVNVYVTNIQEETEDESTDTLGKFFFDVKLIASITGSKLKDDSREVSILNFLGDHTFITPIIFDELKIILSRFIDL